MINRTPEEEWGIKCCSNCTKVKIENYSDDYCQFSCPKISTVIQRGFLDKHYCEDFKEDSK